MLSSTSVDVCALGDSAVLEECRQLAASWTPVLRALAHPERLLIVLWLANASCTVRELQEVTGLAQSLVSYHLGELHRAGLVRATPIGRSNQYRLSSDELNQVAALLGDLHARGASVTPDPT